MPRSRWWWLAGGIAALALAASFNGVWNDFTYDDLFIVRGNEVVHDAKRAWTLFVLPYWPIRLGGDGYRPLTLFALALQWAVAPGSAMLFHAVTVALYVLTSVAVFRLASLLLPATYAWLTAALFAVHPVHVEAVANVVGQSEVWAALLLVSATAMYIQWRRSAMFSTGRKALVALLYFAACLFKEHAVVLPVVLLAAEWLLIHGEQPIAGRLRALRPFFLFLLLISCFYVVFRSLVINKGFGGFSPFIPFVSLHVGHLDRVLTMLGVIPHWVRLVLWPAVLTTEYGPPANPIANGLELWQLPGLLILTGVLGLGFATIRRAPVVAFGITWFVLTLLPSSNFVLPSGILLAERTLFTPSLGAILAVCGALTHLTRHLQTPVTRVSVLVCAQALLLAGVFKSIVQTAVWRNNDTLFATAVATSPMVYRSHYMLGAWMMSKKKAALGEREYLMAMGLFPDDPFVPYNLGQEYFHAGYYELAYLMYGRAERIMPGFQDVRSRLALTRAVQGRYTEAGSLAKRAIQDGAGDLKMLRSILTAASLDELSRKKLVSRIVAQPAKIIAR